MSVIERKSHNFYSAAQVVADLLHDMPLETLSPRALGFLSLDSQLNAPEVLQLLGERVPFPVIGGTSFTYPLAAQTNQVSAVLTVMCMDKLEFAMAVSEPLVEKKSAAQVRALHEACLAKLNGPPKVLMPIMPHIPGLAADCFIRELFALAGQTPVFGGITTSDLVSTRAHIFAGHTAHADRMALLALGGDIKPVFAVGSQLTILTQYGPTVTESDGHIVKRVDDITFCEYMQSLGLNPEDRINGVDALVQYGPLPCRLRHKLEDDDGVPELRCISFTNVDNGSAAFSSNLPVGTKINMGAIQKNDVLDSSAQCIDEIITKIKQNEEQGDYTYSMLFSIPCVARYFAMLGNEGLDSKLLTEKISSQLRVHTFYGFCEIGPTLNKNKRYHNRSHNASIVMCAI